MYAYADFTADYIKKRANWQVSTHQITQYHKVTKISIAISASFVYNVTIRVPAPQMEGFPSRKEY